LHRIAQGAVQLPAETRLGRIDAEGEGLIFGLEPGNTELGKTAGADQQQEQPVDFSHGESIRLKQ